MDPRKSDRIAVRAAHWPACVLALVLSAALAGCDHANTLGPPPPATGPSGPATPLHPTSTTLTVSTLDPQASDTYTLTATVTPAPDAYGSVTFTDISNNQPTLKQLSGGVATLPVTSTPGTHYWTAHYNVGAEASSTSSPLRVAVHAPGSTCGLGPSLVNTTTSTPASGATLSATATDASAVCAEDGSLSLDQPVITGSVPLDVPKDDSGLGAAVLAFSPDAMAPQNSHIDIQGGSVTQYTVDAGAVFASGAGASVTLNGSQVISAGSYPFTSSPPVWSSYAIGAARGGSVLLNDVTATSTAANAYYSAGLLFWVRSGGTVAADGSSLTASYQAAEVDGPGSVTLTNSSLTGSELDDETPLVIFAPTDLSGATEQAAWTMTGGTLTWNTHNGFYPTFVVEGGASAGLAFTGVTFRPSLTEPLLVDVEGTASVSLSATTGTGDFETRRISPLNLAMTDGTQWTGEFWSPGTIPGPVTLTLDVSSTWTVTADCALAVLNDSAGISGTAVTNIVGNGHTVTYISAQNPALGGRTYTLAGGGVLKPAS